MQNIINGIDKATKAGVFGLDEVLAIARSIDQLTSIVQKYQQEQQAAKDAPKAEPVLSPIEKGE